jgi:fumarate hydratase subunit beta
METLEIKSPIPEETVGKLKIGTKVLITGVIYVARDAAHKRLVEALDKGEKLPFDIKGQTIFYMGPSPARPGRVIGAAGPTTSARMDGFTPRLLQNGLRGMIGKGERSQAVRDAIKKYHGVYFVAAGGAGALLAKTVKKSDLVAYPDLGAEAIIRLDVEDFPAIVADDIYGGDLFEEEKAKYRQVNA